MTQVNRHVTLHNLRHSIAEQKQTHTHTHKQNWKRLTEECPQRVGRLILVTGSFDSSVDFVVHKDGLRPENLLLVSVCLSCGVVEVVTCPKVSLDSIKGTAEHLSR